MLVLKRQKDELIILTLPDGSRMSVFVCDVRGDAVKLGFEAPSDVTIHRKEIQDAIDAQSRDDYSDGGLICGEDGT